MLNTISQIFGIIFGAIGAIAILDKSFPTFRPRIMAKVPNIMRWKWPVIFLFVSLISGIVWYFTLPTKNKAQMFVRGIYQERNNYGDFSPISHALVFYVEVFNHGKPSILRDWELTIIGLDKKTTKTDFVWNQDQAVTVFPSLPTFYDSRFSIVQKTQSSPIPTGGEQYGYVLFTVQNLQRTYMQIPGTIFELTFKDIDGICYTNDFRWPLPSPQ